MACLNEVGPKVERAHGGGALLVYGLGALGGGLALLALPTSAADFDAAGSTGTLAMDGEAGSADPVFFGPTASLAAMKCKCNSCCCC